MHRNQPNTKASRDGAHEYVAADREPRINGLTFFVRPEDRDYSTEPKLEATLHEHFEKKLNEQLEYDFHGFALDLTGARIVSHAPNDGVGLKKKLAYHPNAASTKSKCADIHFVKPQHGRRKANASSVKLNIPPFISVLTSQQ